MHSPSRNQRRQLEKENAKQPLTLQQIPRSQWPDLPRPPKEVWRSRDYLVQVYDEGGGIERISVSSTTLQGERWADGITWDSLMLLKRQCGRGDRDALEVYPADRDIVNVANMRHLWLPAEPVAFAWRKK
jgi:hypothetical protein